MKWNELKYWQSGEWQVVEERLHDLDTSGVTYNPNRSLLFASLARTPFATTRVAIVGQDPYPRSEHCTGVAFETPRGVSPLPASLRNIFREYSSDLGYPTPTSGELRSWTEKGVLLWNAFPSCLEGKPGTHHWDEWRLLTEEIISSLDKRGKCVFIYLGGVSGSFIRPEHSQPRIQTSHPSPLGASKGFLGSKIFSRCNEELEKLDLKPIDWILGE